MKFEAPKFSISSIVRFFEEIATIEEIIAGQRKNII
jgi:hypothetical protein